MTTTPSTITLYGQCCRLHVVGQRVVSDIRLIRIVEVFLVCVLNLIRLLINVLGTSTLLQILNIACPTIWRRVLGDEYRI